MTAESTADPIKSTFRSVQARRQNPDHWHRKQRSTANEDTLGDDSKQTPHAVEDSSWGRGHRIKQLDLL